MTISIRPRFCEAPHCLKQFVERDFDSADLSVQADIVAFTVAYVNNMYRSGTFETFLYPSYLHGCFVL